MYIFMATPSGINIYINGEINFVDESHFNYFDILNFVQENEPSPENDATLISFFKNPSEEELRTNVDGEILVYDGDKIYYNENGIREELHPILCEYIFLLNSRGLSLEPIHNFCRKLMQNPSRDARTRLFNFLQHEHLPITPDGDFLGYKYVEQDFYDCHSRTVLYALGTFVEMNRRDCDDNPNNSCSTGLHVGSLSYAQTGRKTLVLKVNPADVVTVPQAESEKMRVCKVFVLSEYCKPLAKVVDNRGVEIEKSSKGMFVSRDSLEEGMNISFDYNGGTAQGRRKACIEDNDGSKIRVVLNYGDPNFSTGEDERYFSLGKMTNIRVE